MEKVVKWLTEPDQPAVRYLAMRDLMGAGGSELRKAREEICDRGWVKTIRDERLPGGAWYDPADLYRPKYISTNWMLLALSDLGVSREIPWVAESAEMWRDRFAKPDGGFDCGDGDVSELCLVGNTARALVKLGYGDDPKVKSAFEWLVKNQKANGGWHCWGKNGVIDGWEGMSAFAAYPRQKWTPGMKRAVERGLEFYLDRELLREGKKYDPWYRLHFPCHYYYDVLVGLEFVTSLGKGEDPRASKAVKLLKRMRQPDGKWLLGPVHPDYLSGGRLPAKYVQFAQRVTPFSLEAAGRPSKMVTLRALRVLKSLGEPLPE